MCTTVLHLIQNNVKYPPKSKKKRKKKNWAEGFKELILLMTVLDLLLRRPKIQCTFLEVQCQLMYCLLTVSRLQREILPHCAIKVIACDKRTSFLEIIHTFGWLSKRIFFTEPFNKSKHETTCICNNSSEWSRKQLRVDLVTVSS